MNIEFVLNGRKVSAAIDADDSLYKVLRSLGMHSVKCGCETTNCGLCTVHMDGKAVLSCSVLISCVLALVMALAGGLTSLPLPAVALYQVAWAVLAMIFPMIQRY